MTFKRPLPVSTTPPESNNTLSSIQSNTCKVCGDKAHIRYYGALSCQSCKIFFRRNGFRTETVRSCQYNSHCEVNLLSRNVCTSCRLAKCFAIGMSTDLIRKTDSCDQKALSTTKFKQSQASEGKTIASVSQPPVLNLLRNDSSSLTNSDWTLFSNVMHAYETFSLVPTLNDILKNLSSSSSSSNNIHFNKIGAFETNGSIYASMQAFVRSIPDFQVLSMNEQQSLFERNLHGIVSFCSTLAFRDSGFFDNPECFHDYEMVYGPETTKQGHHLINNLDHDSKLLSLTLIIIAFSSNCFIVDIHNNMHNDSLVSGTYRLFGSQNVYVELLWKYMLHQYGYCTTVIRFTGLIKSVLDLIKHAANIYVNNKLHQDYVDDIVEKTKENLVIHQNEPVRLWGKTLQST